MKILKVTFSLASGGAEKFIVELSNELVKSNEVILCVVQGSDENHDINFFRSKLSSKVHYINLGFSKGINFKAFFSIFGLIKKLKPDIIHCHLNTILYLYIPSVILHNRSKFIHTLHSIPSKTIGFKWQKLINKFFYKRKLINPIVISKENKEAFLKYFELKQVALIENGVSPPKTSNKLKIVQEEIHNLKTNILDKVFIHVGRFDKAKNQSLLIEVFNKLIKQDEGVILIIIGNNFEDNNAKKLKKKSGPGIFYLGTRMNVTDYLVNSDAFVLSSLWEGMPMSLLEAMSCGIIPVCTPAGGIPNVIKNDSLGFISKNFSEEEFYLAVKKSINCMESFDRRKLIKYYNSNFSINKCANRYIEIYKS